MFALVSLHLAFSTIREALQHGACSKTAFWPNKIRFSSYSNAFSWASPRGQWRTGKNGENLLQNHLWSPNDPHGSGIDDDDDDEHAKNINNNNGAIGWQKHCNAFMFALVSVHFGQMALFKKLSNMAHALKQLYVLIRSDFLPILMHFFLPLFHGLSIPLKMGESWKIKNSRNDTGQHALVLKGQHPCVQPGGKVLKHF